MVRIRVTGQGLHYVYESPQKTRSTRVCVCVFYLSTALSKRVLPVYQPNGQKLGQSELFRTFLGGEETLLAPSPRKEAMTVLS